MAASSISVRGWLDQEIMADCQRWTPVGGTPQGAVISPLLANLYLHPLDELMAAHGLSMVDMPTTSSSCATAWTRRGRLSR